MLLATPTFLAIQTRAIVSSIAPPQCRSKALMARSVHRLIVHPMDLMGYVLPAQLAIRPRLTSNLGFT